MEYNGWTNYETWNVNLWVDNEYEIWKHKVDQLRYCGPSGVTEEMVQEFVTHWFPEGTPDFDGIKDYFKVNWKELAEDWKSQADELKEEDE